MLALNTRRFNIHLNISTVIIDTNTYYYFVCVLLFCWVKTTVTLPAVVIHQNYHSKSSPSKRTLTSTKLWATFPLPNINVHKHKTIQSANTEQDVNGRTARRKPLLLKQDTATHLEFPQEHVDKAED